MSINSLANSPIPSGSLENFSSAPEISTSDNASPLRNRTVAVDPKPITFGQRLLGSLFPCMRTPENRGSQHEITVDKPRFTVDHGQNIETKGSTQSPLANKKVVDEAVEQFQRGNSDDIFGFYSPRSVDINSSLQSPPLENKEMVCEAINQFPKGNNEENQSTFSGFSRNDSLSNHPSSNASVVRDSAGSTTDTIKASSSPTKSPAVNHAANGKLEPQTINDPSPSSLKIDKNPSEVPPTFAKEESFQAASTGSSKLDDGSEKSSKNMSSVDSKYNKKIESLESKYNKSIESLESKKNKILEALDANRNKELETLDTKKYKDLAKLEKKDPETLQENLVKELVENYQSDNLTEADDHTQKLRQHLSPQLMAAVDKSVIDTLKADGNQSAAKAYDARQVAMQPMHYDDVLKLDQLSKDLKAGRSLERAEQEKLLTDAKETLETIDTKSFTAEQQALLQASKERVDNLERALPLVDNSKMSKGDILKTVGGSVALGGCLAAIGTLIAGLVKLNQADSIDEEEAVDETETESDQTEAIETKKNEIQDQENKLQELKDKEQALLAKGASLPEEEVIKNAELAGFDEVVKQNKLAYKNTETGDKDPIPTGSGYEIIEKHVNEAVAEHRENQTALSHLREEMTTAEDGLKSLQGEVEELKFQQGRHEAQKEIKPTAQPVPNNNANFLLNTLGTLGIVGLAGGAGAAGLFAVSSSKVIPKFKLRRANTQAVQSLNKVAQSNQPQVTEVNTIDIINPESIVRRNTL